MLALGRPAAGDRGALGHHLAGQFLDLVGRNVGDLGGPFGRLFRFFRLSDVATITQGYENPPSELFRYDGKPAIGLAIGMKSGSNILDFGKELKAEMARIEATLPVGVSVHEVADQSTVVEEVVGGFTRALFEAVAIVLVVSFISLGLRAGLVVALSIPLVLAISFVGMDIMNIDLQRVSLGALIITLGLLVDDAMIAIETMVSRLEAGDDRKSAASFAWTSIAFPMLTGTLVTVAGFLPIGFNASMAGEYTFSLFQVFALALLLSWIVAVLFSPLLGVVFLPTSMKKYDETPSRVRRFFSSLLKMAMRWRYTTIAITVALFAVSVLGMQLVQQQFFPSSDRLELVVDFTLRHNSTIAETKAQMDALEATLGDDEDIDHWSSYVGRSAVRFIFVYDIQPSNPFFGQVVIVTKSLAARARVRKRLEAFADKSLYGSDIYIKTLELGPPVGHPVQYRLGGPDIETVRSRARDLAALLGKDDRLSKIVMNWNEPARVLQVKILQDKARQLGVSSEAIASTLNQVLDGVTVTQVRDDIYLIDVVARGRKSDRDSIDAIENLQLTNAQGKSIPLASLVSYGYGYEDPILYTRSRTPTITVSAAVEGDTQPATIVSDLEPAITAFAVSLPEGYSVEAGGSVESSVDSQGPVLKIVSSGAPLGFGAILGVLALIGILIRNSVILVHQIGILNDEGLDPWNAVFRASQMRARPILLTRPPLRWRSFRSRVRFSGDRWPMR